LRVANSDLLAERDELYEQVKQMEVEGDRDQ